MPANIVAVVDIGGQIEPQGIEKPRGMLLIEVAHVVAICPFKFPIGLGMVHRRADQPNAHSLAKRGKKLPFEAGAVVKYDRLWNDLPLAHSGDDRADRSANVRIEKEIAEHIAARIIVHERQVIGRLSSIGKRDLFQEIPVPKTVRMVAFVEPPCWDGQLLGKQIDQPAPFLLAALERGWAYTYSFAVP